MTYHILNIGQNYRLIGGSDRYLIELEGLLEKKGHKVVPFAARDKNNLDTKYARYFPAGANFNDPSLNDILLFLYSSPARDSIKRVISDMRIDIAHLHIYYGKITTSILPPLVDSNIPIVQTCHDLKLLCPISTLYRKGHICEDCKGKKWYKAMVNRCNRGSSIRSSLSMLESYISSWNGADKKVNEFIAVSNFLKDKMVEHGISESKISVIHNYIDTTEIRSRADTGEYLLYFGRIERYKGIFTLLNAARDAPEVKVLIVGSGKDRPEIEEYIRTNRLRNIILLDFMQPERLAHLIQGAICTVNPSELYETFGLSIIESFAYGKPVLASRIGGMPEIISHGRTGFLFEPGNTQELKDLMNWMWKNPAKAKKMGVIAREHVEKEFGPETHYRKLKKIYDKYV